MTERLFALRKLRLERVIAEARARTLVVPERPLDDRIAGAWPGPSPGAGEVVHRPRSRPLADDPMERKEHDVTEGQLDAAVAARRAKAATELGQLAELVAEARARVPPSLTVKEALARREAVMRAAAVRAGHPWAANKED